MPAINTLLLLATIIIWYEPARALPIGFGRNLGDLEYDEIKSKQFHVYFDERVPQEGRAIFNTLQIGQPVLERWLQIERQTPLPVVLSSTTAQPSFANFITDVLELQTRGQGDRDLAWHELTHNIMYRHLDNIFGPTGSIIHLPWMPAWWIEGLAEATSRSIGSEQMYAIERFFALTDSWPSYDKLHSLYRSSFATVGYAVSGSFVTYILRTYGTAKLGQVMTDFFDYSMPWWWPWSVVPFNNFMPWDAALVNYTGKTGEQLYEDYKAAARQHWQKRAVGRFLYQDRNTVITAAAPSTTPPAFANHLPGQRTQFSGDYGLELRGGELYKVLRDDDTLWESRIRFNDETSQAADWERLWQYGDDDTAIRATYGDLKFNVHRDYDENLAYTSSIYRFTGHPEHNRQRILQRAGRILEIFASQDKLIWLETKLEHTRICYITMIQARGTQQLSPNDANCILAARYPTQLTYLGHHNELTGDGHYATSEIWFRLAEETVRGDRYRILSWKTAQTKLRPFPLPLGGKPVSMSRGEDFYLLLLADRSHHFLRKVDLAGSCQEERHLADFASEVFVRDASTIYLTTWGNRWFYYWQLDWRNLPKGVCQPSDQPISPLHFAMSHKQNDFHTALTQTDGWQPPSPSFIDQRATSLQTAQPLHRLTSAEQGTAAEPQIRDAAWRGRPLFALPWIGADVAGYQLGSITVPLMDEMQNETLRFSALYGVESRYPNLELSLVSNRFKTTWAVDVFRRQRWNGSYRGHLFYYDERGLEVNASRYWFGPQLSTRFGLRIADLKPYLGPDVFWQQMAKGYLQEFTWSVSRGFDLPAGYLSTYLNGALAPQAINGNYDYDKLGLGLSYSLGVPLFGLSSRQNYGISYSRTRGTRRHFLREVYRPLKTFVPGSGGGFNEINVSLIGPGALTSASYGDTQARAKFAWTFPLVRDLETLIHIFYLERLDFTAFYNYGQAWWGGDPPPIGDFVQAHGYNLDLQSDIKGVTVNLGLGTGQVVGYDFEIYFLFGFDALIDP